MRYFTDQNGPKEGPHENEIWVFSYSEMNVTNGYSRKSRWKKWVICLVLMFPSWSMVLNLSGNVDFCAYLSKKSKSIKQFTYMHLKGLVTHFQKMVLFIMLWLTVSEILEFEICWFSIFFDTLIANISWTVDQTLINHTIFWKSVMRTL